MGKKTSSTTNTSAPPQYIQTAQQGAINQAQNLANNPYQAYQGAQVAGFTPAQMQAFQSINGLSGMSNPYINTGANLTGQATNSIANQIPLLSNPANAGLSDTAYNTFTQGPQDILGGAQAATPGMTNTVNNATQQYMNPYMNTAIQGTLDWMNNQDAQQQTALQGNAISAGAWGGDRAGVAAGVLGGQQALAKNNVISQMENQGYGQAQQTALGTLGQAQQGTTAQNQAALGFGTAAQQDYATQLAAAQQAASQQGLLSLYAGQQMGSLGTMAQQNATNAANAQLTAGQQQQQQAQSQLNVPYQNYLNAQQWPYQQVNFLDSVINGTAGLAGNTTTQQQPAGSVLGQLTGAAIGLGGSGAFGNTGWLTGSNGLFSGLFGAKRGGAIGYDGGGAVTPPQEGMSPLDYLMLRNKQHLFGDPLFDQQQAQQAPPAFPMGGPVNGVTVDNILANPRASYQPNIPSLGGPSALGPLDINPISNYGLNGPSSPTPSQPATGGSGIGTPNIGGGSTSVGGTGIGSTGGLTGGFAQPAPITAPGQTPTSSVPTGSVTVPYDDTNPGGSSTSTPTPPASIGGQGFSSPDITAALAASGYPAGLGTSGDLSASNMTHSSSGLLGTGISPSGATNAALFAGGLLPGIGGTLSSLAGAGLGFYNGTQGLTSQPLNSSNSTQGGIANWLQNPGYIQQGANWLGNLFASPQMSMAQGQTPGAQSFDSGMQSGYNQGSVFVTPQVVNPLDLTNIPGGAAKRGGAIGHYDDGGGVYDPDNSAIQFGAVPPMGTVAPFQAPGAFGNNALGVMPQAQAAPQFAIHDPSGIKVTASTSGKQNNAGHAGRTMGMAANTPSQAVDVGTPSLTPSALAAGSGEGGDWWSNLATNPHLAMMAMGLGMMGSKGNFGQAIAEGGMDALKVAQEQAAASNEMAYKNKDLDLRSKQLDAELARYGKEDEYRNKELNKPQLVGYDNNNQPIWATPGQTPNTPVTTGRYGLKSPTANTKPMTQNEADLLAQKDWANLLKSAVAQGGPGSVPLNLGSDGKPDPNNPAHEGQWIKDRANAYRSGKLGAGSPGGPSSGGVSRPPMPDPTTWGALPHPSSPDQVKTLHGYFVMPSGKLGYAP